MKATSETPPGVAELTASKIIVIQALVARLFGLNPDELDMNSQTRAADVPRWIAIYLAKQETNASLTEIGNLFGGEHHTTVLQAIEYVETLRRTDSRANIAISMLLRDLNSSRSKPSVTL